MGRTRWRLVAGILLLAAGGAWWWSRTPAVQPPEPAGIEDAEVRAAVAEARQAVADAPADAAAWGQLAKVFLAHLFDQEADDCFAQAARLEPAEALWTYGRALIALKRRPDEALELLRQATLGDALAADRAAFRLQCAEALLERGQLDEAEAILREELGRAPVDARAALSLGLIVSNQGEHDEAVRLLTTARASPAGRKKATVALAALARGRGDAKAADAYEREIAMLPADPPWPDPLLDEVIRLQVGRRGRERLVARLEEQGRYHEAAALFLRQLETAPSAEAYVGAGINLARLRDYDRALPLLRSAVREAPDSAHAHYSLALALFAQSERAAAGAPAGAPTAPELTQRLRETVTHARRAVELRPDHARAYLFWGLGLKLLGDSAGAVEPLRIGVACAPEDFELQYALGEALRAAGRGREAASHLENARRLNPNDPRPAQALEQMRAKAP